MNGEDIQRVRETRAETQEQFAKFLNKSLGRQYDKARVSRWEGGKEPVPGTVAVFLLSHGRQSRPAIRQTTVIAAANQKGGVAKTTSTVTLASALAKLGKAVLVIDADPQASATIHLGQNPRDLEAAGATLYHVLLKNKLIEEIIIELPTGFSLVPSSIMLSAADGELIAEPFSANVLREKVEPLRGKFDFVLIDCPPNLSLLTVNSLSAADKVLIPCRTSYLDIMGVPLLLETIEKIRRRGNPNLSVLGILPTMYNGRLTQDRATLDELQTSLGAKTRVFQPVARSTGFEQASAANMPVLDALPDTPGVQSYLALAQELCHG
jgi:chromosome partitioning protein